MTISPVQATWTPMSVEQRTQFDRDGYLIIRGVLTAAQVQRYTTAIDEVYAATPPERRGPDGSLHALSAVTSCPELSGLIAHPNAFPLVWSILGWNVHVYHSHLDVHPRVRQAKPPWWHWHQDGGRQNRELETDPRPRLSVKLAFWLSDVSQDGRGNLTVVPGSHRTNWLPGPPRRDVAWPAPVGAVQVRVHPGDVVFFDRRLWHARTDNASNVVRKVAFFGYTYRWIAIRDDVADLPQQPWWSDLDNVQRQLLGGAGDGTGDHRWGHDPASTPLYGQLRDQGLLDATYPPLIP